MMFWEAGSRGQNGKERENEWRKWSEGEQEMLNYRLQNWSFALSSTYFRSLDWGAVRQNPVLVYGNQYSSIQECPVCSSPLSVKCHISTSEFEDGICDYTLEQQQMPYWFFKFVIRPFHHREAKFWRPCALPWSNPLRSERVFWCRGISTIRSQGIPESYHLTYGKKQNSGCLWVESETATDRVFFFF